VKLVKGMTGPGTTGDARDDGDNTREDADDEDEDNTCRDQDEEDNVYTENHRQRQGCDDNRSSTVTSYLLSEDLYRQQEYMAS
jgi:hypothetical protein